MGIQIAYVEVPCGNTTILSKVNPAQNPLPLAAILADDPDDDNSGQVASQGFGYQEWYAVLLVVELLKKPDDFAVGLEVKEDISVIDSITAPTKIEFCQVKTSEQALPWALTDLHRKGSKLKDGTHPPSILGKLYKRRREFNGHETRLRFISNSGFKIKDGKSVHNSHDFHLEELSDDGKKILRQTIAQQLSVNDTDIELSEIRLHRSNLPLGEQNDFISGKLSALATTGSLPFKIPQPDIAAKMLASEIKARASNTSFASTFDELKLKRFFSRDDAILTLVRLSQPRKTLEDIFDEGIARLNFEHYDYSAIEEIKMQRVKLFTAVVDRTNILFRNQISALSKCHLHIKAFAIPETKQLGSFMEAVAKQALETNPQDFSTVDKPFLYALTFMVIHNGIDINVLTTKASPEPEVKK